jgi:hypothetical protein
MHEQKGKKKVLHFMNGTILSPRRREFDPIQTRQDQANAETYYTTHQLIMMRSCRRLTQPGSRRSSRSKGPKGVELCTGHSIRHPPLREHMTTRMPEARRLPRLVHDWHPPVPASPSSISAKTSSPGFLEEQATKVDRSLWAEPWD